MIGRTLLHYKIIEKIGAGGMGEVYRARDTKLDRDIALKVLPEQLARDPERRKRFEREAKAIAALKHPNIVTIHSVEKARGVHFLTMELVEGKSLSEVIPEDGLSLNEFFALVVPLTDAVNAAHAKGIAHRDLKPANIMLDEEGRLKILDFGLAKLLERSIETDRTVGADSDTGEGRVLGTVAYMSPEQAEGSEIDHRSDVFSLGVILYEMATGRRPFKGKTNISTITSILRDTPPSVTEVKQSLPRHLGRIVNRCLAKSPNDRYQSVLDLRNDLRGLRDEEHEPSATDLKVDQKDVPGSRPKKGLVKILLPAAVVLLATILIVVFKPFTSEIAQDLGTGAVKLAVLPFVNLGQPEDEYFADGITDEIISRLAVIKGLAVISRTSAMKYKNTDKGLREIGQELGVDYILEGTIRWARTGNDQRVRITPQLVKTADDFHLWAENYERDMTEIFAVQADIATKIADALDVTLLASERRSVEARPTESLEAYEAHLRGMEHAFRRDYNEENLRLGIQMFERAVRIDPEFVLGYAQLSQAHSAMVHFGFDRTEDRRSKARQAVDRALELQPEHPEAHLALGYYHYWGRGDFGPALAEWAIAGEGLPNDSRILAATAYIWRRQGKNEAALENLERASELSPREETFVWVAAEIHGKLRQYREAERYWDVAISLAPDRTVLYWFKAANAISWRGDVKRAKAIFDKRPRKADDIKESAETLWLFSFLEREYEAALRHASSLARPIAWLQDLVVVPSLMIADTYVSMGRSESALAAYDSARTVLEQALVNSRDDWRVHSALGRAYAGLGRKEDAIRHGERATELLPLSEDAALGAVPVLEVALIYTAVGQNDDALNQIETLLSIPSDFSVQWLRIYPFFDPLRGHPRYQQLLETYGTE